MELIFKKYHNDQPDLEENYLFFDPAQNKGFSDMSVFKKLSDRNFAQNFVKLFVGPFMEEKGPVFHIFSSNGMEETPDSLSESIANTYLRDRGYPLSESSVSSNVKANGTIYYFPN